MSNNRLQIKYKKEIIPALQKKFGYKNIMAVPKVEKIFVTISVGRISKEENVIKQMISELALITGQQPVITKAKKSISNFKIRAGMPAGVKVTLRGTRMYDFLDRFISIVLPRVRDFKGIPVKNFDRSGNISVGLKEHSVFPEISLSDVKHIFGLEVTIATTATKDEEAEELLRLMGFPFSK